MASTDDVVNQWFAQTVEAYPRLTARFLAAEKDPFRNPVGHALRSGMAMLVEQILGGMNREQIESALDEIIRMRAVQDFKPSEAVGFVFLVRAILLGSNPPRPAMIEARVDQLALMAFDHYMKCRAQIAEAGANEARRSMRPRPVLRRKA